LKKWNSICREKRKDSMISAGDAEFPRDYHTLAASGGRGARRFLDNSNGGFTSSSLDRRHNSVAAKSLEALNSMHKADIERQRDALMDLQKNKYTNSPGSLSQGSAAAGRQVSSHTIKIMKISMFLQLNHAYFLVNPVYLLYVVLFSLACLHIMLMQLPLTFKLSVNVNGVI
ncbi:hypothetical protein XENOCAPTIV_026273, partial [Xenoophorus captivus]